MSSSEMNNILLYSLNTVYTCFISGFPYEKDSAPTLDIYIQVSDYIMNFIKTRHHLGVRYDMTVSILMVLTYWIMISCNIWLAQTLVAALYEKVLLLTLIFSCSIRIFQFIFKLIYNAQILLICSNLFEVC